MDNSYCCVPQCNSLGSNVPRPSFHRFPTAKDESSKRRREEWIRILKIGKTVSARMVVCGKHFQPSDFFPKKSGKLAKLKSNAVPSQNLPLTSCEKKEDIERKLEASLIRSERKKRRERLEVELPLPPNIDIPAIIPGLFDDVPAGPSLICSETHNIDIENEIDDEMERKNLAAAEALLMLHQVKATNDVATQVTSGDLIQSRSFIKKLDDAGLKAITGLHSSTLKVLEELLLDETGRSLKNHQMPVKDQIILTLMRLKLDISFIALSVFFECSAPTCKAIFKDTLKLLAAYFKNIIRWFDKEYILANMPQCFKKYSNTRVVLDCTEVAVTKPDCLRCRVMTYSTYYTEHTIKVMVGISPGGIVTFLSPVFGGRASDKSIFDQSRIIEFLQPHEDAVMVDKGFLIDEACKDAYIELLRPPFLRHKTQFSAQEAAHNTRIARARVHVERMIQRIKIYKIFDGKLPWGMLPHVQNIFTVCAGIANMGNPILAEDKF